MTTITEKNINEKYQFMNKKERKENINLIHFAFNCRGPVNFEDIINIERKDLVNFWKYKTYSNGRIEAQSYFDIEDTLKPLDEYAAEIKKTVAYREYLIEKLTNNHEVIFDTLKYTVKVYYSSNGFDIDVFPKGTIPDEDGEFNEDLMLDGAIIQDGDVADAINYAFEF